MKRTSLCVCIALVAVMAIPWGVQQASAQNALFPPGIGFNPAVDYTKPNYANSPNLRKFVDSLPGLGLANKNNLNMYIPVGIPDTVKYPGSDYYEIGLADSMVRMHSDLPNTGTKIRGYYQINTTDVGAAAHRYLGPAIIATRDRPVRLKFTNKLGTGAAGNLFLPVDMTVMGAGMGPIAGQNYTQNRATIHLHGGLTPWISDGTPHQWVTPAGDPTPYKKGVSFQNVPDMIGAGKSIPTPAAGDGMGTFFYPNTQAGRLMFYHDHAYGITRLNVYAGEAAPYLLVDPVEQDLISGKNLSGGNPAAVQILPDQAGLDAGTGYYHYGIPLVIQDKTFVNGPPVTLDPSFAATKAIPTPPTLSVDPLWATYVNTPGGYLWFPHEYMPIENIFDPTGGTTNGRWDYAPFMIPPMVPQNLTLPSPTIVPETFCDTMVVNGMAFPYVTLPPTVVRFRILNACNDRMLNLSLFKADPAALTEVKMVDAVPNAAFPTWPKDGRAGGVPDPTTKGPDWIQIGNECGFLAQVAVKPAQPVDYEYNRQNIPFAGIISTGLFLPPAVRADVVVDLRSYKDGDTLIVYNDAPAPAPAFWPINDYYTGDPDQTAVGGAPSTPAGFGPNTRTVMQIRIKGTNPSTFNFSLPALQTALPTAFAKTADKPIVPQLAYNAAFPGFATSDIYGQSVSTTLNITGKGQSISQIKTTVPGNGYTTAPLVKIIPTNGGSGATATATINPVSAISVVTAGTGYTTVPTVTVAAPTTAGGVTCTAVATISGGLVNTISIVEPGSGYTVAPVVTIAGGGGTGATATSTITLNTVGSIKVTNAGSGYIGQPRVYLTGGGGMGAAAEALTTGSLVMTGKNMTEGFDPEYGRMFIELGSTPNPLTPTVGTGFTVGISRYIDPPTEMLNDGETIIWRITHLGVDSHAMHFHLFNLQVVNRVDWTNLVKPPYPDEIGWKETIRTNPMEDIIVAIKPVSMKLPFTIPNSNRLLDPTTVAGSTANFNPIPPLPGIPAVAQLTNVMTNFGWEYVWHCHLLGHEENDMMRPLCLVVSAPAAPTTLTASSVPTVNPPAVTLAWKNNAINALSMTVQRATNTGFTTGLTTFTLAGNATGYVDTTVAANTRYYYRVNAVNGQGTSAWSNVVNLLSAAGSTPQAPTGLAAGVATATTIPLTWTSHGTSTSVIIQYQPTFGTLTTVTVNGANLASATLTGLTTATTYSIRVAERNAVGTSTYSNTITVTTP